MKEANLRKLLQASDDTRHSEIGLLKEQTMALEDRQHKLGPNHPACFESKHELALVYFARRDQAKAEPLSLEA